MISNSERNPRIIAVNGDVCSGSSTLARALAEHLGYNLFDVGQHFRRRSVETSNPSSIDDISLALNALVMQCLNTGKREIIEGRLVGRQSQNFSGVLKLLCIAEPEIITERFMMREGIATLNIAQQALNDRYNRDREMLNRIWGVTREDIFSKDLYDLTIDTSHTSVDAIVSNLRSANHIHKPVPK